MRASPSSAGKLPPRREPLPPREPHPLRRAPLPPPTHKTAKVHHLVELLRGHAGGMHVDQISAALGVDLRTVKRYLSDLRRMGYALEQEKGGAGRRSLYRIPSNDKTPIHLIPALKKLSAELHAGGNPKHAPLIRQVTAWLEDRESPRAEAAQPAEGIYHIDHGPFAEANPLPNILKSLEAAIADRKAVKLTYSGYAADKDGFLFYPYVLSLRVGTLYLVGRQDGNKGPFKSLSVKRIRRCVATQESFVRAAFDPAEQYKYTFGQWARQPNETPDVVLLALKAKWLEKYLSESHFNPPGKVFSKGNESFFEVKLVVKPDFVNWVLSLAPDLVPMKPDSLRKEVAERLRRALAEVDPRA
ncbi:MAG: WYL domain-containing protein [Fibrobacteres bacterium]|jgi:predicted DNA-binding transcriptional regulator YafY|nr:WYL domain-containing protein [Fibrobacterota bacterium]